MVADAVLELLELRAARQLAVQQQVADFDEGALGRELLDWIAAVHEHASLAIDVGDFALDRSGSSIAWVVGEGPKLLGERRDVHHRRAQRAGTYGQQRFLAGGGINEFQFLVGHVREALHGARRIGYGGFARALHGGASESRQRLSEVARRELDYSTTLKS